MSASTSFGGFLSPCAPCLVRCFVFWFIFPSFCNRFLFLCLLIFLCLYSLLMHACSILCMLFFLFAPFSYIFCLSHPLSTLILFLFQYFPDSSVCSSASCVSSLNISVKVQLLFNSVLRFVNFSKVTQDLGGYFVGKTMLFPVIICDWTSILPAPSCTRWCSCWESHRSCSLRSSSLRMLQHTPSGAPASTRAADTLRRTSPTPPSRTRWHVSDR